MNIFEDYKRKIFYIVYPTNLMSTLMKSSVTPHHWYLTTSRIKHLNHNEHLMYLRNDLDLEEMYDVKYPFDSRYPYDSLYTFV